jgi:hypothetical protein
MQIFLIELSAGHLHTMCAGVSSSSSPQSLQFISPVGSSKTSTPFPKDQLRAHKQGEFSYPMSAANVHIAFRTVIRNIGNEGAVNLVKSVDNYVFHDHEDTTLEEIHHMLKSGRKSVKNFKQNEDCDWEGKHCKENHLMTDCPIYLALNNRDKLDHVMKVGRCFNCYRKGHKSSGCISELKCTVQTRGAKHDSALHKAWTASSKALSLLTKTVLMNNANDGTN